MSKPHRGSSLRELHARGRGVCPVCKKTNIKVLYEQEAGDQKFKLCKVCRAAVKHGTKSLPVTVTAKAPASEEAPAKAAPAAAEPVAEAAEATPAAEEPAVE